jgi:hypothetical protein
MFQRLYCLYLQGEDSSPGLWVVMLCSVVVGYQRFGGPCCLQLQSKDSARGFLGCDAMWCCDRIPAFRGPCCLHLQGEDSSRGLLGCDAVWCCFRIPKFQRFTLHSHLRWRQHGPLKCRYPTTHYTALQRRWNWIEETVNIQEDFFPLNSLFSLQFSS